MNYKGYRVVHVATMHNGNTDRSPITRWMTKADAISFARTLEGHHNGTVQVESKSKRLIRVVTDHNAHMIGMGF